jgi:hypothetical protein
MAGGFQGMLHGAWFGPHWSRDGLPGRVAAVVLDEADALLGGGFAEATNRVLEVCFSNSGKMMKRSTGNTAHAFDARSSDVRPRAGSLSWP